MFCDGIRMMPYDGLMASKKIKLGNTGEAVRENVKRRREAENLSYAELSRRLEEIGNPIPPLGLRRIESGERKVDVDDLAALASILRTTPPYLLMPDVEGKDDLVAVTGNEEATASDVWHWLTGYRSQIGKPEGREGQLEGFIRSNPRWLVEVLDYVFESGVLEKFPDSVAGDISQTIVRRSLSRKRDSSGND